jgi:predicted alpha-1,2-mannosidase
MIRNRNVLLLLLVCFQFSFLVGDQKKREPVDYVNTLIGTSNLFFEFSHGNTYPAVCLPFGMTSWTPQTRNRRWMYDYKGRSCQGFRGTHQSNVWMGDYGSVMVMPVTGKLKVGPRERSSSFSHRHEIATPYYYRVLLEDYRISAELSATMRCCIFRFTFPSADDSAILIDTNEGGGEIKIMPGEKKITGFNANGGDGHPKNFRCYFVAEFDKPFSSHGTWIGNTVFPGKGECGGKERVGAFVKFETGEGETVQVRISTSFIGFDQARLNLRQELGNADFQAVKARSREIWNRELSILRVDGGSPEQQTLFYSALFRALQFPRTLHEFDENGKPHHYSPYNGKIYAGVLFGETGFWDTYRAQFPLLVLFKPAKVGEIITGLLNAYREGGWIPKWPSPGYRSMMTGTHADAVIADARAKGITSFDLDEAFRAMVKAADHRGDKKYAGRVGIEYYKKLGFVPVDRIKFATSRTLEFAYDDFCVARIAAALGRTGEYNRLMERSRNYRRIFDKRTGFMRGRNQDGSWLEPFNPLEWGRGFCEGNAWHYLWSVQHDIAGLVKLLGGKQPFIARLDRFLGMPSEVLQGSYKTVTHEMREMKAVGMGQYAHNNEPVHHVLYLYDYVGQPWKTQKWVRQVMDTVYRPEPAGMIGDDDNGQMSAWFVFSAMGFYPVCPGKPQYAIGSPLFPRISIRLVNGRQLVIRAKFISKRNIYIQQASFNGHSYSRNWIDHADLMKGGKLEFIMGPNPNQDWGSRISDLPPGS